MSERHGTGLTGPPSAADVMRARATFERAVVVWLAWILYARKRFGG